MAVGDNSSNMEKLIGILVSSDKDIVVNSGSASGSFGNEISEVIMVLTKL